MVGFGRPGVDLHLVTKSDHQELDPLVLDNLKVHAPFQVAYIGPAVSLVILLERENPLSEKRFTRR